jgi:threonine dehydratase
MTFIPPADDFDIMLRQATAATELNDQVRDAGMDELDAVRGSLLCLRNVVPQYAH